MDDSRKNGKKDWRQKGLGWVPDYPDARDYTLEKDRVQEEGKLKRDEVTIAIENLANSFITTVEKIQYCEDNSSLKQELKKIRYRIEKQVFGQIKFDHIKIHKILKKDIKPSQEVIKLKYYLHLLSLHDNFETNYPIDNINPVVFEPKNNFNSTLNSNSNYWEWLNSSEFEEYTEEIVKIFQEKVGIKIDGIVGLETYSAIREYLLNPEKEVPMESSNDSLIKLVSVPSLIPSEAFRFIFEKMKSWWKELVCNNEDSLHSALQGIKEPKDFSETFNSEFSVVEPLVSVVLESICPLAQYDSWGKAVSDGLDTFHDTLLKNETSSLVEKEIENSLDLESAKRAICKVQQLINYEREHSSDDVSETVNNFYDFLEAILKGYQQKCNLDISEANGIFDKTHLIEIEPIHGTEDVESEAELNNKIQEHETDLFTSFEFSLPVSRTLYKTNNNLVINHEKKYPKPYFFLPGVVDLSFWCSPVEDQGSLNSCAAFAGVALIEYFALRSKGEHTDVSPLFLYKVARNLMKSTGDVGASIRETMRAMVAFGVPPEKYWSYEEDKFEEEPPAFCYSYAQNYQTIKYFRLDYGDISGELLLFRVKAVLAAGFPCMFGFTTYSSIYKENNFQQGYIPYPSDRDYVVGGHVVVAVGYNDDKEIPCANGVGKSKGTLLIRNSWGTKWGKVGYGWLPYDYVLKGMTADWWSLLKAEWFEAGNFGLGAYDPGDPCGNKGELC